MDNGQWIHGCTDARRNHIHISDMVVPAVVPAVVIVIRRRTRRGRPNSRPAASDQLKVRVQPTMEWTVTRWTGEQVDRWTGEQVNITAYA